MSLARPVRMRLVERKARSSSAYKETDAWASISKFVVLAAFTIAATLTHTMTYTAITDTEKGT